MRLLPAILAMATIVVASNILVQFVIAGGLLTLGAFTYPFAFLVIDLTNRLQLFTRATSLGGPESLIEHRASVEGPTTISALIRCEIDQPTIRREYASMTAAQ